MAIRVAIGMLATMLFLTGCGSPPPEPPPVEGVIGGRPYRVDIDGRLADCPFQARRMCFMVSRHGILKFVIATWDFDPKFLEDSNAGKDPADFKDRVPPGNTWLLGYFVFLSEKEPPLVRPVAGNGDEEFAAVKCFRIDAAGAPQRIQVTGGAFTVKTVDRGTLRMVGEIRVETEAGRIHGRFEAPTLDEE